MYIHTLGALVEILRNRQEEAVILVTQLYDKEIDKVVLYTHTHTHAYIFFHICIHIQILYTFSYKFIYILTS